jgi:hypothetical protein
MNDHMNIKGKDVSAAMEAAGHDMELLDTAAQMMRASSELLDYLSERIGQRREIIDVKTDAKIKDKLAALLIAGDRAGVVLAKRAAVGIALVTGGEVTEIPGVGMMIAVKGASDSDKSKMH